MPVLDLQLYVGEDGLIKYIFYQKPCSSPLAIPASSAHTKQQKLAVMVGESLQRTGLRHQEKVPGGVGNGA